MLAVSRLCSLSLHQPRTRSAHADGRGAVNLTPAGIKSGGLVAGLRPALKLYFWVSYQDAAGKTSKPSPVVSTTLVDAFQEK